MVHIFMQLVKDFVFLTQSQPKWNHSMNSAQQHSFHVSIKCTHYSLGVENILMLPHSAGCKRELITGNYTGDFPPMILSYIFRSYIN